MSEATPTTKRRGRRGRRSRTAFVSGAYAPVRAAKLPWKGRKAKAYPFSESRLSRQEERTKADVTFDADGSLVHKRATPSRGHEQRRDSGGERHLQITTPVNLHLDWTPRLRRNRRRKFQTTTTRPPMRTVLRRGAPCSFSGNDHVRARCRREEEREGPIKQILRQSPG